MTGAEKSQDRSTIEKKNRSRSNSDNGKAKQTQKINQEQTLSIKHTD